MVVRRSRPATRVRTRPRRTVTMAVVAVVALLATAILGWTGFQATLDSRAGTAGGTTVPVAPLPVTPATLLVVTGADGEVATYAVLSLASAGAGGTLVLVSPDLLAPLPGGDEPERLGAAFTGGGLPSAQEAIEAFLGVRLPDAHTVTQAELPTLLAPAAPFTVELAAPVELDDGARLPAGRSELTADEAALFLTAAPVGEGGVNRLARTRPVWSQVVARGGTPPASTPPVSTAASAPGGTPAPPVLERTPSEWFAALRSGSAVVDALPLLEPPDGAPPATYATDPAYLRLVVARTVPGLVSPSNVGTRVWLRDPYGDEGLQLAAAGKLTFVGANLVMATGADVSDPPHTEVVFVRDANRAESVFLAEVLGGAMLRQDTQAVDGIDVIITLGPEFRDVVAAEQAAAGPASTTVPATTVPATTVPASPSTTRR